MDHLFPALTQRFCRTIEQLRMTYFILHFCHQCKLALETRGPGYPGTFRECTYDLTVCMLLNHSYELHAVELRHPVGWLDLFSPPNPGLKSRELNRILLRQTVC